MRFAPLPEIEQAVNLALHRGLLLRLTYWGGGHSGTSRVVRPEHRNGPLLTGFCFRRQGYRTFHLGRVIFAQVIPKEKPDQGPVVREMPIYMVDGKLRARTRRDMVPGWVPGEGE